MLIVSTPLDLVAIRLASLRLRPLPTRMASRTALWPASGIALAALGWWEMGRSGGWGPLLAAFVAGGFAEAARIERITMPTGGETWLFSRRNAVFAAIPFAAFGGWTSYLLATLLYAAASFFIVQHVRHKQPS
jgi:hypothetical protein